MLLSTELVAYITASSYRIMYTDRLSLSCSVSAPQPASTYAVNWLSFPGGSIVYMLVVAFRYLRAGFAASIWA